MLLNRRPAWAVLFAAAGVLACDDDPSAPAVDFRLTGCPTGPLSVNAPITLGFTQPVLVTSVNGANVVVSDAATGLEIPGALSVSSTNPSQITFASERPLTFGRSVRIRVQNIRPAGVNSGAASVIVCDVAVEPPFITQLYWRNLPQPTGTSITGVSLVAADRGFVTGRGGPVFRRDSGDFVVIFTAPNLELPNDIAFATRTNGLVAYTDVRNNIWRILESVDGATFDTIATVPGREAIRRVFFRATGPNATDRLGVIGGGSSTNSLFGRYDPVTKTFTYQSLPGGANVWDIDFANDNLRGAAVATGVRVGTFFSPGEIFVTSDGGNNWTRLPNGRANSISLGYRGVAIRENGDIFVSGFSGYLLRLTPAGGGAYNITRIGQNLITNPDSTNPNALLHSDVEFVRGQDTKGWLVGRQQVGTVTGTPRFQGYIFETKDGGVTWVRQGVAGARNFGAEMPALNRMSVLSTNVAWIGADDGSVLEYKP